jgi:hypothetical protein
MNMLEATVRDVGPDDRVLLVTCKRPGEIVIVSNGLTVDFALSAVAVILRDTLAQTDETDTTKLESLLYLMEHGYQ